MGFISAETATPASIDQALDAAFEAVGYDVPPPPEVQEVKVSPTRSDLENAVIQAAEDGLSNTEAGNRLGIDRATISKHARRLGVKLKDGRGKAHSKYSEDDLLALHRAGLTQTAAAEVLGVHITSVHKKAKRMGLRWGRK